MSVLSDHVGFDTLNISNDIKSPINSYGLDTLGGPITGIEIEVEQADRDNLGRILHSWRVDNDGSLRNNGLEFISKPTKAEHVESALRYLYEDVLTKAPVHFSPRTSVHVHMNCRNLTFMQIYNIVILYQCFEDLLYDFAGPERKKSIFCVPIGNTHYYTQLKTHFKINHLIGWSKYTGLNLCPLQGYGTIEFRHLRGTSDLPTIMNWLRLLYRLYSFATNTSTKDLEDLIQTISNTDGYSNLCQLVFNNDAVLLTNQPNYQKKMAEDIAISKLFMQTSNIKEYL